MAAKEESSSTCSQRARFDLTALYSVETDTDNKVTSAKQLAPRLPMQLHITERQLIQFTKLNFHLSRFQTGACSIPSCLVTVAQVEEHEIIGPTGAGSDPTGSGALRYY